MPDRSSSSAHTTSRAPRAPTASWLTAMRADVDLTLDARRVLVEIPVGFTEMLAACARARHALAACDARIFTTYLARGYRAVDFSLDRASGKGAYLLEAPTRAASDCSARLQPSVEPTSITPAAKASVRPPSTCRWMWKTVWPASAL